MPHEAAPTDEDLLQRSRDGDGNAFRLLVERYEDRVAATVISMLGRTPEADDVGQETFIRFYRSIDRFRGDASLGTYITRIAINQSIKALKRRQKWTQRFFSHSDDDAAVQLPAPDQNPVEDRERADIVRQGLQQLGPDHRAVVVLRILEGYSTRETAAMLGLPEGTVMSRLSRALQKLEHILGPLL